MAMAEGERTECAEPPREEPPADGALKRAEELKTQANDYFKGASGPDGGEGGWTAVQAMRGARPRGEPWQRGAAARAPGKHYGVAGHEEEEARDGRQTGDSYREVEYGAEAPYWGG